MVYQVERYPSGVERRKRACKYPFAELKPGEGFIYDEEDVKRVRSAVNAWNRRNPDNRVRMRTDDDGQRWVIRPAGLKEVALAKASHEAAA